jgi:hypothetical protein
VRRRTLIAASALAAVACLPATAAQASAANGGGCVMNSSYCTISNQYGPEIGPAAPGGNSAFLITYNSTPDAYHFTVRPSGTWGEIKDLNSGLCWNFDQAAGYLIAQNGCNTGFTNGNELWRLVPHSGHWVIQNYNLGLSYFVWLDSVQAHYVTFDSHIDNFTTLDFTPLP